MHKYMINAKEGKENMAARCAWNLKTSNLARCKGK